MSMPPVCYLTSTSNLTLLLFVRRLFTRLSDVAPSFIVVDASFAPGTFAPATVVCTQYLSLCTRYLEYLGFPPYPVTVQTRNIPLRFHDGKFQFPQHFVSQITSVKGEHMIGSRWILPGISKDMGKEGMRPSWFL
jgi:hypothetical protein